MTQTREEGTGQGLSPEEQDFLAGVEERIVSGAASLEVAPALIESVLALFGQPALRELVEADAEFGQLEAQLQALLAGDNADGEARADEEAPEMPTSGGTDGSSPEETPPTESSARASGSASKASIRVGQERIDEFLVHVGEMLMSSKSYSVLENRLSDLDVRQPEYDEILQELKLTNRRLNEVSYKLQNKVLALRKQPARQLLSTAPRMVLELAKKLGKDVLVETEGDEVEVDRSTLDLLKDPMTHMLRNSLDHGLETPEQREEAGKGARGRILLRASTTKKHFQLEIIDDGRGIDTERVGRKAVEAGALRESELAAMDERDKQRLIFHPGLSTAEKATDVSGRGVGMDSVLSNVTQAGGRVDVESELGKGTTVFIEVPLAGTLMVIPALMVEIAGAVYYMPIDSIREVLERGDRRVQSLPGGGEVVEFRDQVRPFVRTGAFVPKGEDPHVDGNRPYWVLAGKGRRQCCLEIDRLRGIEQIIVLDLGEQFPQMKAVQGAALTGDGRVALVLDVGSFLAS